MLLSELDCWFLFHIVLIANYPLFKSQFAGSSARFRDPRSMGPGFIDDIRGTSDHMNAAHNVFPGSSENLNAGRPTFQGYRSPAGQSSSVQQGAYHQSYAAQQSAYQSYPAKGGYPSGSPSQLPYQNTNSHQAPYQSINPQQQQQPPPYKNMAAQGSYHYWFSALSSSKYLWHVLVNFCTII